ncbi:hypothetical protein DL766_002058 [Monosporascus sp. MC13-8B]|uniref:Uncharacterized protein n=1 Tax=Monosporascus cannonballus TaxID=155416 RepID=A0ABY0HF83_9PEZI|nr:hypothetical protein DL763_006272 [Monosporascus cannonballus]RYO91271.1 hypothetical protein DL762_002257 [Monosporascus cannonballus]RYP36396.1 hypothetical protein DL766_002058 [Monosporascus sp. MC13-8B]
MKVFGSSIGSGLVKMTGAPRDDHDRIDLQDGGRQIGREHPPESLRLPLHHGHEESRGPRYSLLSKTSNEEKRRYGKAHDTATSTARKIPRTHKGRDEPPHHHAPSAVASQPSSHEAAQRHVVPADDPAAHGARRRRAPAREADRGAVLALVGALDAARAPQRRDIRDAVGVDHVRRKELPGDQPTVQPARSAQAQEAPQVHAFQDHRLQLKG